MDMGIIMRWMTGSMCNLRLLVKWVDRANIYQSCVL
jgi:hypothetical protein